MFNYEEVEKIAKRVEATYAKLDSINAQEDELLAKPRLEYEIPDIITDAFAHDSTMSDLYTQWSVDDRLRVLDKQRAECRESLKYLEEALYKTLIPNHWYVFNTVAIISVVWINGSGYVSWRIDIERFEDRESYIKFNGHNMAPVNGSSQDFITMGTYAWFQKVGKGPQ